MNDPNLVVQGREARGLDVNDITGGKGRNAPQIGGTNPQRLTAIRPRVMEYDIINPGPKNELRMSAYGKNVLSSRQQERTVKIAVGSPAGKQHLAKLGEASINQIWPADEAQRKAFGEKNRNFETHDINHNNYNMRQFKLKE